MHLHAPLQPAAQTTAESRDSLRVSGYLYTAQTVNGIKIQCLHVVHMCLGDSPDEDLETSQGTDTTTNSTGKHYG